MVLKLTKKLRIQTGRTKQLIGIKKWFYLEWVTDITSDKLMSASLTMFGISFVYLGTAA